MGMLMRRHRQNWSKAKREAVEAEEAKQLPIGEEATRKEEAQAEPEAPVEESPKVEESEEEKPVKKRSRKK